MNSTDFNNKRDKIKKVSNLRHDRPPKEPVSLMTLYRKEAYMIKDDGDIYPSKLWKTGSMMNGVCLKKGRGDFDETYDNDRN